MSSFPYGSYRRRIRLVARTPDTVEAGIEDDFHHFRITLRHDGAHVRALAAVQAIRIPWTTCGDAGAQLQMLEGMPLERSCLAVGRWTSPHQQCTHMFDLAGLAAAHAYRRVIESSAHSRQYDAEVPYGFDRGERKDVQLWRDGTSILTWTLEGDRVVAPSPFSDVPFTGGFFRWAATSLPPDDAEGAIVLRRACTIGMGRGMDQDAWSTAADVSAGPTGVCYSQQPERRGVALRVRGNIRDFDPDPDALLSDGPHEEDLAR